MAQAIRAIQQYTAQKDLVDYQADSMLRDAVEREFQILGDALVRLLRADAELARRIGHHDEIIAFRNVLVHEYDRIDTAIVWRTIRDDLPAPKTQLEAMLGEPDDPTA